MLLLGRLGLMGEQSGRQLPLCTIRKLCYKAEHLVMVTTYHKKFYGDALKASLNLLGIQTPNGILAKPEKSNGKLKGKFLLAALMMEVEVTGGFMTAAVRWVLRLAREFGV